MMAGRREHRAKTGSMMVGLIDVVIVDPKQLTKLIQKHNNQSDVVRWCIGNEEGASIRVASQLHLLISDTNDSPIVPIQL